MIMKLYVKHGSFPLTAAQCKVLHDAIDLVHPILNCLSEVWSSVDSF